jgi:hypothetical protein
MRESRTYGSVRGALSNERPYRDRRFAPRNDYNCIVVGRLKALKLVCAKCFFPWSTKRTRHART